ncbi:MAG: hypothetical protein ACYDEP_09565 [Acidimicrobiales bacterium]
MLRRFSLVILFIAAVITGVALSPTPKIPVSSAPGGNANPANSSARSSTPSPRLTRVTTAAPATTTAPVATTTTTVDPGTLPQTDVMPSSTDPAFIAKMTDLIKAVATGNPALAYPAFFPLSAYLQVKAIPNPAADYQNRLINYYNQDIATLHSSLGPSVASTTFVSVDVPPGQAEWIVPGVEYNKGSYWRVYGTVVHYSVAGVPGQFTIASMISWRGEWYIVHLLSIR